MVYGKNGLQGYDVEPYSRSVADTLLRLLRRVGSGYGDIARVTCWSTDVAQTKPPVDVISTCFPNMPSDCLPYHAWN